MTRWRRLPWILIVLTGTVTMAVPSPMRAQECMVATGGPLTLTAGHALTACATNLDATPTVRVGIAFYDAFNARAPLRLEHIDLAQGAGGCSRFRTTHEPLTLVVRTGYVRTAEDTAEPLALSAEWTVSRAETVHLRLRPNGEDVSGEPGGGTPPPPPPV